MHYSITFNNVALNVIKIDKIDGLGQVTNYLNNKLEYLKISNEL